MSWLTSRRMAAELLVFAVFAVGLFSMRESLRRSLAFIDVRGQITDIETRHEKHPGIDDRHFVTVSTSSGSRVLEIGAEVAARLEVGALLDTTQGGDGFLLDGEVIRVAGPDEGWAVGIALWCGLLWVSVAGMLRRAWSMRARGPEAASAA